MPTIYIDRRVADDTRRRGLYEGDIYIESANAGSQALCALARELSEKAFSPHQPEVAQESMAVEDYVAVLADLKPTFIHHPDAKACIREMLTGMGCDPEKTYFDVPRLRTMAHGEYLKAGLALQFHAHRDTWFSAPQQQINFWLPVYEIQSENSMGFYFDYFGRAIRNSSADYDYAEWNRTGRQQASSNVKEETRKQPHADEPIESLTDVRVVTPVGGALVFSAAQLHATVPNTTTRTRFSIDFRTVNIDDLLDGTAAANADAACTGTTLGDFMRLSDLEPLPQELVERYDRPRHGDVASAIA